MARVKRSVVSRTRRKKILKMAKGYRGRASKCYKIAKERVEKGLLYAYRDRKVKKRDFRHLWIVRINAALREMGFKYSTFINKLNKSDINLNRKILANLACSNSDAFKKCVMNVMGSEADEK